MEKKQGKNRKTIDFRLFSCADTKKRRGRKQNVRQKKLITRKKRYRVREPATFRHPHTMINKH